MRQMQETQLHIQSNANAQRRRTDDNVRFMQHMWQSLEVLLESYFSSSRQFFSGEIGHARKEQNETALKKMDILHHFLKPKFNYC